MNQALTINNATVVSRDIRGENSLYIVVFSPEAGLVHAMKKISAKKTSHLPDLFDDISANIEKSSAASALKFIGELDILNRRTRIGASYENFQHASLIANTVLKNGRDIEDTSKLSERLKNALDSIESGAPAEIVRLKFMYLLARDEGYAVKEDFFPNLSAPKRELFATLIKTPSSQLKDFRSRTGDILESLCRWIASNTDIAE